jgi:hypothetical protein
MLRLLRHKPDQQDRCVVDDHSIIELTDKNQSCRVKFEVIGETEMTHIDFSEMDKLWHALDFWWKRKRRVQKTIKRNPIRLTRGLSRSQQVLNSSSCCTFANNLHQSFIARQKTANERWNHIFLQETQKYVGSATTERRVSKPEGPSEKCPTQNRDPIPAVLSMQRMYCFAW